MYCLIFTFAVLLLALSGILLMVGWKSGASQLARIAIALVVGSAILSWFGDVLRAFFSRPIVATAVGGFGVLLVLALILLGIGWFFKLRATHTPGVRPTIRRRAALMGSAEKPTSESELLEAPLTVVDLGGDVPMGFLPLVGVIGSLVNTILTSAVFCRKTPAHPVMFFIDEWQTIIGKSAAELERLLSQARFRQVNVILANQTLGQITDTSLLRSLVTNISLHWAFRPGEKDIEHVVPLLPITGRFIDPERPDQFLSKQAERRQLLERLTKLPPRHALLSNLVAGRSDIILTLSVPYGEAKRRAAEVPAYLRESCRRGRFGVPFSELLEKGVQATTPIELPPLSVPPLSVPPRTKPARAARPRLVLP